MPTTAFGGATPQGIVHGVENANFYTDSDLRAARHRCNRSKTTRASIFRTAISSNYTTSRNLISSVSLLYGFRRNPTFFVAGVGRPDSYPRAEERDTPQLQP